MELIADEICRLANLRKLKLFMPPQNVDQRKLTRKERLANMQRVMHVRKGIMPDMLSRPVVLIDDVCTTGATIYGAANALHEAGFSTVYGLTFGKVQN